MKSIISWSSKTLSILIFCMISFGMAQVDDDLLLLEEEEISCEPESLVTPYDKYSEMELEQGIPMLYSFGTEYYKNKSYKDALPYLWKVFVKGDDKYARAAVRKLADIYFYQGKIDSTLIVCYKGLKRFPDLDRLHHYAGTLQEKLGKGDCAIPHFEELVKSNPQNVDYLKILASLYYRNQDERAVEYQKKVVELKPDDAEERDLLANMMTSLMDPEEALKQLKANFEGNPDNADYAFKYGKAAVNIGNFMEALKPLETALKINPTTEAYNLRAQAYENLGNYSSAIADYKSSLNLKKNDADIMLKIANDYKFLNNFGSAKYWVNKALSANRGYGLAYITMGEIIEAAVPYCQKKRANSKTIYEDKLVYAKAKEQYDLAKRDAAYRSKAQTKISYLAPLLPTKEDNFMNQGKTIKSSCYDFVK